MIDSFRDKYFFLSNFFPCVIRYREVSYRSVEAAFQAQKIDTALPEEMRKTLQRRFSDLSPDQAKHLGRRVELRPDWENVKDGIMRELLLVKFGSGKLREWLLATGDETLVEGNTWHDNYWGSCICPRCRDRGRNELGKALMAVRRELQCDDRARGIDEEYEKPEHDIRRG